MEKNMKLSKEKKDGMIAEIITYFRREREEEIGELGAVLFLNFIVEKLAPEFYNLGVYDAHKYMLDRVEDLLGIQK